MKRRAELEELTRRRITESAVELHGTLGPSRTSMSAVAEHAGVRRSTLYRHFPDEPALFEACTAHWRAANPAPDLARWAAIADPDERLRSGLAGLYAFYGRTEGMMGNLVRDEATVPIVEQHFGGFRTYLGRAADTLMTGRPARRGVRAAIGHALAFTTWQSLVREQKLSDRDALDVMCRLVAVAGESGR
jgi:AcrR family transcriptional regulator